MTYEFYHFALIINFNFITGHLSIMFLGRGFTQTLEAAKIQDKIRKATIIKNYEQEFEGIEYNLEVKFFDNKTHFILRTKEEYDSWLN